MTSDSAEIVKRLREACDLNAELPQWIPGLDALLDDAAGHIVVLDADLATAREALV